ncbi:hypothetical protein LTR05_004970 [Lithohypha guttulata]|uniref:Proteasome inhibitor PI31 subunit n=1 Tax=Lithohypha guttulata TaxID=1690604 RepID=A0AAN7YGG1_9EURO|nr:hypothetical protein LTR05_004970 [Lithohypha guttulata]
MASNTSALSADSLISYISQSIPADQSDKPSLKNVYSALALLSHACMLAVGFRLVGLGEDDKIEAHSEPANTQPLPTEWDQHSSYAFRYTHPQSSMEFLLKVTRLGEKAIILGVGLGDDKTAQLEIKAQDYTSENSLKDVKKDERDSIKNAFISSGRIEDLSSLLRLNIIQKLIPGLRKEGYEESTNTAEREAASSATRQPLRPEEDRRPDRDPLRDDQPRPARPYPFDDPLAAAPRRPGPTPDFAPPGFEDEYDLQRPAGRMPPNFGQPFGNIGDQDLYPPGLGPHDPLRIGPGGGYRGGGGMHPTFDDPLFQGQGGPAGYDPRAPPGARYDPVGPGDGPPNLRGGPGRFPGGGGFGGGRPPNPFGGFGGGDFI